MNGRAENRAEPATGGETGRRRDAVSMDAAEAAPERGRGRGPERMAAAAGRRGPHRIVFGKRVARPGGPALAGDHEITSVTPGFPDELRQLCLSGALAAGAEARELLHPQAPERGGFSIRPAQAQGAAYVLAERLAMRPEDGADAAAAGRGGRRYTQAEVWAFDADLYAASAPALLAQLPELVRAEPEIDGAEPAAAQAALGALDPPAFDQLDLDGGARLAAALISETELAPFTRADFADEAAFWRAAAALAAALPMGLRPLFSAADGFRAPLERPLLRYLPQAAGAAHGRGAPDALEQIRRRLEGAWTVGWRTAADAGADLRNLIQDAADAEAQTALKRFLTDRASPPAPPPDDPHHREVYLRRLIAAAHTGAAFRTRLPDFGRARAAGLIATATDDASEPAWDYIRRTQPSRLFWGAFLLNAPGWFEPEPIQSLRALSRLLSFDQAVRSALAPGTPTPADGPAFKGRVRRLAARGAQLLTLDPQALLDEDREGRPDAELEASGGTLSPQLAAALSKILGEAFGPEVLREVAPWVRLKPDLFAELPAAARDEIGRALDAVEAAARVFAADAPLLAAVTLVRAKSLDERLARNPQLEDARVPLDFALRWMTAIEAGSRSGAAFWKAAFERWFETAAAEGDAGPLDSLIAFRRRLRADKASHGAVARALEAATQRFAARRVAAAEPSGRLAEALWTWRRLWLQGGPGAAASMRATLLEAAADPDAAEGAVRRDAGGICVALIETLARGGERGAEETGAPGFAGRAKTALDCGLDAAAVFRRLWAHCPDPLRAALRAQQAAVLGALDAAASLEDPDSGRPALELLAETRPQLEATLFEAVAGGVLSWGLGPTPAPVWPRERGGALIRATLRRFGGALALYAGRYPGARSAPSVGVGPPEIAGAEAALGGGAGSESAGSLGGPADWAAYLADHGAAADRTLACNAVAVWRGRFEEALARRAHETPEAAPEDADAVTLSPIPSDQADALALAALRRLVGAAAPSKGGAPDPGAVADLEGLIGSDAVWTLRQFTDLALDPKDRPGHAAAPAAVRDAWSAIAYARDRKDLFEPEMFFLFLASRIAAGGSRALDAGAAPDPVSAPFLAMLRETHYAQRSSVGVLMSDAKGALKGYIWQRPVGDERTAAIEALEDDEIAARMDRALLFLGLAALDEQEPPAGPDLTRLWSPLRLGAKELQRLHPPPRIVDRLTRFLHPEDASMLAEAHRHYRAALEKVVLQSFSLNRFSVWRNLLFAPPR